MSSKVQSGGMMNTEQTEQTSEWDSGLSNADESNLAAWQQEQDQFDEECD